MSNISIAFLIMAGILFLAAMIILFSHGKKESPKKAAKVKGGMEDDYALRFNEYFLTTGNIGSTLEKLQKYYEGKPFMEKKLEEAISYYTGDYGDYETTLSILNPEQDIRIKKAHSEAIRAEIAKQRGIPAKFEG